MHFKYLQKPESLFLFELNNSMYLKVLRGIIRNMSVLKLSDLKR